MYLHSYLGSWNYSPLLLSILGRFGSNKSWRGWFFMVAILLNECWAANENATSEGGSWQQTEWEWETWQLHLSHMLHFHWKISNSCLKRFQFASSKNWSKTWSGDSDKVCSTVNCPYHLCFLFLHKFCKVRS